MVHDYAMGTGSPRCASSRRGAAETTRRVRDEEVCELADEAFRAAVELLSTPPAQLDKLAGALLANEVVERADIERIMAGVPRRRPDRRAGIHLGWRRRR